MAHEKQFLEKRASGTGYLHLPVRAAQRGLHPPEGEPHDEFFHPT
jgi:hypothetical protein